MNAIFGSSGDDVGEVLIGRDAKVHAAPRATRATSCGNHVLESVFVRDEVLGFGSSRSAPTYRSTSSQNCASVSRAGSGPERPPRLDRRCPATMRASASDPSPTATTSASRNRAAPLPRDCPPARMPRSDVSLHAAGRHVAQKALDRIQYSRPLNRSDEHAAGVERQSRDVVVELLARRRSGTDTARRSRRRTPITAPLIREVPPTARRAFGPAKSPTTGTIRFRASGP